MEENLLFRMNFILQDNAATTLDANLVKFIENILLENGTHLTSEEIKKQIETRYQLEFSEGEIETAIRKKGKNIIENDNRYFLKPNSAATLGKRVAVADELKKYVKSAIVELSLDISEQRLYELVESYLYYCFNTNKDTLLALVNNEPVEKTKNIRFSNDEIKMINEFLQWENDEKNRCVYKLISYCYIYCTLTVKKDNLLGTRLFRGKRFILDANIIFRLAGINNDSRKRTILSFVNKCKEVGIDLCYTEETLDEVYRVITTKVKWIKKITDGNEPLDLSQFEPYENDFYKLYLSWCKITGNSFDDYQGFQTRLLNLVGDVLAELKMVKAENYEVIASKDFSDYLYSLGKYKSQHTTKIQSQTSLKTDVNNVMHVLRLRSGDAKDLWSAKEFLISADQNLIGWAADMVKGIPIVVLPSVWLTIILRFSGRQTSDDYKAFCGFLELRQHNAPSDINVYSLVERLTPKTSSNDLKRKIIEEVFYHKDEYKIDGEDSYDAVIDKAFDKILNGITLEGDKKIDELQENLAKEMVEKAKVISSVEEYAKEEKQKNAFKLAIQDQKKHFGLPVFLNKVKYPVAFILLLYIIILFVQTCRRTWWLYNILIYGFGEPLSMEILLAILGLIVVAIGAIAFFVNKFLEAINSEIRKERYREKREKYYLQRMSS